MLMTCSKTRTRAILAMGALLGLLSALPAHAQGEPPSGPTDSNVDSARQHFLSGVDLYREGDFRAAIIEFERAYEAAPNFKVFYNIGQAHLELQDYAAAHVAFKRFLEEGGSRVDPAQRKKVEDEIRRLAGRIANARIRANVDGATILVDDVAKGTTPLSTPLVVSAGRRKFSAQKQGYLSATRSVDVAGGDEVELDLALVPVQTADPVAQPQPAPPKPAEPAPVRQQPETGMGTAFWVSLTATGVLAAGSGVMGVLVLDAQSENDDKAKEIGVSRSELADSKSKVQDYALATDVLAGAALLAGGLTIYFAATAGDDASPTTEVGFVPGGAVVRGSF